MKLRRIAGLAAAAPLVLLAACGGTPATPLSANWYRNTEISSNLSGTEESLVYSVTFLPDKEVDPTISSEGLRMSYDTGEYTVRLNDESIPWESGTPQGYHLHSELTMTGRVALDGTAGEDFHDSVVSDVWFLSVAEQLRPVRSEKTVVSTLPMMGEKDVASSTYTYRYRYIATYEQDLSKSYVVYDDLSREDDDLTPKEIKLGKSGLFFDNEQILFVIRGIDLNSSFSFRTVNPVSRKEVKLTAGTPTAMTITGAAFTVNGAALPEGTEVKANTCSISYDIANPGSPQELTYAAVTSPTDNAYRSVLLTMETAVYNSYGTLQYALKQAVFNDK